MALTTTHTPQKVRQHVGYIGKQDMQAQDRLTAMVTPSVLACCQRKSVERSRQQRQERLVNGDETSDSGWLGVCCGPLPCGDPQSQDMTAR